jgi:hypothetical protein
MSGNLHVAPRYVFQKISMERQKFQMNVLYKMTAQISCEICHFSSGIRSDENITKIRYNPQAGRDVKWRKIFLSFFIPGN